jgi:hypothetical protein
MKKEVKIFVILATLFVANAILAEFLGVKIFSLEQTLGFDPIHYNLLGIDLSLTYTAGVIIWPFVFILTDVINDYFGHRGVRFLTILASVVISYAFFITYFAIHAHPADWWILANVDKGIADNNQAYKVIFGQGMNIIVGSLTAFIIGQFLDIYIFQWIKKRTNDGKLWLRATVSTLVSQFIDSFVVLYIAFYIGQNWSIKQVLSICFNNYFYKGFMAIALIPLLHLVHHAIERYLGKDKALKMRMNALHNKRLFDEP